MVYGYFQVRLGKYQSVLMTLLFYGEDFVVYKKDFPFLLMFKILITHHNRNEIVGYIDKLSQNMKKPQPSHGMKKYVIPEIKEMASQMLVYKK